MKRAATYTLLFLLLVVGCTPTTAPIPTLIPTAMSTLTPTVIPTATNIPTPEPTLTPIPLADLEGILFFDYNGNGLRDVEEPPIVDFGVCVNVEGKDVCNFTDGNGHYKFEELGPVSEAVSLRFVDPNADKPTLAFRYINLWRGEIVIPAYEREGVQVPEQHLNDTVVVPLQQGVVVRVGEFSETGLMQGFLSWPLDHEGFYISTFYDHEPAVGRALDWRGNTVMGICNQYTWPVNGICENHDGTDFIAFPTDSLAQAFDISDDGTGAPVFASLEGTVNWAQPLESGSLHVTLDHRVGGHPYQTGYSHLSAILVRFGERVYRGQLIGLVGSTGTSKPHLHFNLHDNTVFREDGSPATLDPWGDPSGLYLPFWIEYPDPSDFPLRNNR